MSSMHSVLSAAVRSTEETVGSGESQGDQTSRAEFSAALSWEVFT